MTWSVTGPRHVGITVLDLDRSLEFYCGMLGMRFLWRRVYRESEMRDIVGVAEMDALEIAMIQVPGSELTIELLVYHGCASASGATSPKNHGSGHLCLFVAEIDELYADLSARGVAFRSPRGPVEMSAGANRGGKSLYGLDPNGFIVEFHQAPPR